MHSLRSTFKKWREEFQYEKTVKPFLAKVELIKAHSAKQIAIQEQLYLKNISKLAFRVVDLKSFILLGRIFTIWKRVAYKSFLRKVDSSFINLQDRVKTTEVELQTYEEIVKSQRQVQIIALERFLAITEKEAKEKSSVLHAYELARESLECEKKKLVGSKAKKSIHQSVFDLEHKKPPFFLTGNSKSSNRFSKIQSKLRNQFNHPSRVDVEQVMINARNHAAKIMKSLHEETSTLQIKSKNVVKGRPKKLLLTPHKMADPSSLIKYSPLGRTRYTPATSQIEPFTDHRNNATMNTDIKSIKMLLSQLLLALHGE